MRLLRHFRSNNIFFKKIKQELLQLQLQTEQQQPE